MMETKECTGCGCAKPHSDYPLRYKRLSDGFLATYRGGKCKSCRADEVRRCRYKRAGKVEPPRKPRPNHWPRPLDERECDAAFMGWRAVESVAFQGARL